MIPETQIEFNFDIPKVTRLIRFNSTNFTNLILVVIKNVIKIEQNNRP